MSGFPEQRSVPRAPVPNTSAFLRLLSREPAQILDVSAGGALLETSAVTRRGASGRLVAHLKGRPFTAAVQVTHVRCADQPETAAKARVGVAFEAMDEESREALGRFLGTVSGS